MLARNRKGFTILEVAVVSGLILLILAIVMPNIPGIKDKGNDVSATSELQKVSLALSDYYLVCGEYPKDISRQIDASASNGCAEDGISLESFLDSGISLPYVYIPLSLDQGSGVCDTGYILSLQIDPDSPLLDRDHDYVADSGTFPYFCSGGESFLGDDLNGWYDFVSPATLR